MAALAALTVTVVVAASGWRYSRVCRASPSVNSLNEVWFPKPYFCHDRKDRFGPSVS